MSRMALALTAVIVLVLCGCGNSRTPVPSLMAPRAPGGLHQVSLPAAGITLLAPRNWPEAVGRAPLLASFSSGSAVAALWSFARQAPPPSGDTELAQAQAGLLSAVRRRDPGLQLIRAAAITVDGYPAVELDALERIGGNLRRVRSVHIYLPGREIVLDAYAAPDVFHQVDHAVFSPLRHSLQLPTAAGSS